MGDACGDTCGDGRGDGIADEVVVGMIATGPSGDASNPAAAWERKVAEGGDTGEDGTNGRWP